MADRSGGAGALSYYDPGADAALRHPSWVIRHRNLHGVPEVMCPQRQVILIENSQDRSTRRCNLAHAIAHIDLGHQRITGALSARQELAADKLAARRLISARAMAAAAVWSESFEEMASELDVDTRMLFVRAKFLHPAERHLIHRWVEAKEQSA